MRQAKLVVAYELLPWQALLLIKQTTLPSCTLNRY